jgi:uncharacterized membrane-anchored protein
MRHCKFLIVLLAIVFSCSLVFGQQHEYNPIYGPAEITLGDNIAKVQLPKGFVFLDRNDTRKLFEEAKEPYLGDELGVVLQEGSTWFALFRYVETGHIRDDEADKLDPDSLLETIIKNTREANRKRKEMGLPTLEVIGWDRRPHYNRITHTLTWSIIGRGENAKEPRLNYRSVILGRYGILFIEVVSDYANAPLVRPKADLLTSVTSFTQGKRYEQWVRGDKQSDITMAKLITGGTAVRHGDEKTDSTEYVGGILVCLLVLWLYKKLKRHEIGVSELMNILGYFKPGLHMLVAVSSPTVTTFLAQIATCASADNWPVVFVNLGNKINFKSSDRIRLFEATNKPTISQIQEAILKEKQTCDRNSCLVIINSFQQCLIYGLVKVLNTEAPSLLVNRLDNLYRVLNVSILILSEIPPSFISYPPPYHILPEADWLLTGGLEHKAHTITLMKEIDNHIELVVVENKHTDIRKVRLVFDSTTGTFRGIVNG